MIHSEPISVSRDSDADDANVDAEKKQLRREIKLWWQGVAEHIDKLVSGLLPYKTSTKYVTQEEIFTRDRPESSSKSLPRLPSVDDDYDDVDTPIALTPKPKPSDLPSQPDNPLSPLEKTPNSGSHVSGTPDISADESESARKLGDDNASSLTGPPPPIPKKDGDMADNLHCLQSLRHSFQRTEQSLYALLSRAPISSLNDVRTSFLSAARGAARRLAAWQNKHVPKGQQIIGELSVQEPEWWKKSCHAIPCGGNIIVREDDWGSLIAFTLG